MYIADDKTPTAKVRTDPHCSSRRGSRCRRTNRSNQMKDIHQIENSQDAFSGTDRETIPRRYLVTLGHVVDPAYGLPIAAIPGSVVSGKEGGVRAGRGGVLSSPNEAFDANTIRIGYHEILCSGRCAKRSVLRHELEVVRKGTPLSPSALPSDEV